MDAVDAQVWVLHAFDVAREISLAACAPLTTAQVAGPRRREWPQLFGLEQRPLVWSLDPVTVTVGARELRVQPRAIIYDFGNVSVALRIHVDGPLDALRELAVDLEASEALDRVARDILERFVARAGAALHDVRRIDELATYTVYQLDAVPGGDAAAWLAGHAATVAQILRAEAAPLAADEIADATARRLGYTRDDLVVIDATAAFVIDREGDDTLAVLDFANCERLALRVLDDDLDQAVDGATRTLRSRASRWRMFLSPWGRDVRRLTQLTFDASAELESVDNAIKLTGDHYLARVYRLAVERFALRPFHEGIARKLGTLWSIQKVFIDQAATRRAELLEWINILLIAYEIVRAVQ
ncbi:MAG: hypothetical protein H6709_01040 [Kofleriaceae bacterium]|nr:hypothetical protein [Myxococcales bacterium]MCB9558793.1 hypothetical protein [Kofleriaceae bacterium]MCB9570653.1 hypothetical protein [Kofleriaceae bacterium]